MFDKSGVSDITFEQTVRKIYDIYGGHLGFLLFVHFLQKNGKVVHLGCVPEYL